MNKRVSVIIPIVMPFCGYLYYIRQNSISKTPLLAEKRYTDSFDIWEEHLSYYRQNGYYDFALAVKRLAVDKYISHAAAGTAPSHAQKQIKPLFDEYSKQLLKSNVGKKYKLRLRCFRLFGARVYNLLNRRAKRIKKALSKH